MILRIIEILLADNEVKFLMCCCTGKIRAHPSTAIASVKVACFIFREEISMLLVRFPIYMGAKATFINPTISITKTS